MNRAALLRGPVGAVVSSCCSSIGASEAQREAAQPVMSHTAAGRTQRGSGLSAVACRLSSSSCSAGWSSPGESGRPAAASQLRQHCLQLRENLCAVRPVGCIWGHAGRHQSLRCDAWGAAGSNCGRPACNQGALTLWASALRS